MYNLTKKTILRVISKVLNKTKQNLNLNRQRPSINDRLRVRLENDCIRKFRYKSKIRHQYEDKDSSGTESFMFTTFDDMMFIEMLMNSYEKEFSRLRQSIKKFKQERKLNDLTTETYKQKKKRVENFLNCESRQKREKLKAKLLNLVKANEIITSKLVKVLDKMQVVLDELKFDSIYAFNNDCFPIDYTFEKVIENQSSLAFLSNECSDNQPSKDVLLSLGQYESLFADTNQNLTINEQVLISDKPYNLQNNLELRKEKECLLKEQNELNQIFKCDEFEKSYGANQIHGRKYSGIKPFKCNQCEKAYTSRQNLEQHHQLMHTEEKKLFKCDECEKKFLWNSYLKKHKLSHGGNSPHKCHMCEKTFTTKQILNYHVTKTHDTNKRKSLIYKCDECEDSFSTKISFRKHRLTHMIYSKVLKG